MDAARGWALVRDRGSLTAVEVEHLKECPSCNAWMRSFLSRARNSGFVIAFEIPLLRNHEDRAKGA
jgi:predicted anti-sigma-YlaC factor YlaD